MRVKGIRLAFVAGLGGVFLIAAAHSPTKKTVETRIVKKPIPRSVSYQLSRTLGSGRMMTQKKGCDGSLTTTFQVTLLNGKPIAKVPVKTERIEPVNDVVLVGKPAIPASRSSFSRSRTITMRASAYDTSPQTLPGSTGRTATGIYARYGVVAVDPRVIKLGTYVFVEGYGFAIAADTGGAIKGNRIDLCFNSRREALNFGRKTVKVHILE